MLSSVTAANRIQRSAQPLPPSQPARLQDLFAGHPLQALAIGEAAFWEGDPASYAVLVAEGCLRLFRVLPTGRRVVVGFAYKGEILGISSSSTYAYTAEAVTAARLGRLPRGRFQENACGSEALRPALLTHLCREAGAARQHMILTSCCSADERMANFLVSAARRTGSDRTKPVVVDLPMGRADIADYLGITVETVCRVLSRFKGADMIESRDRHTIVLHKFNALRNLAGLVDDEADEGFSPVAGDAAAWTH